MAVPDTIVALSSAAGAAERSVVRVSGPEALAIAGSLAGDLSAVPGSTWVRRELALPGIGDASADLFVFRAPRSYTSEDLIELHLPGSAPLVQSLLSALIAAGARPAGPGEFTRRAFLAGRLRLDQAEAVLQLVSARSEEAQRAAALRLRSAWRELPELRQRFVQLLAVIEAYVDFTEEDTEALDRAFVARELASLGAFAERVLAMLQVRPAASPLPEVLLIGPRNAGKTSLFRMLVPDARAIVSPIPGSTRDLLEGVARVEPPWRVWDGPGVGEAHDALETRAIERALEFLQRADLALVVLDGSRVPDPLESHRLAAAIAGRRRRVVLTHADVGRDPAAVRLATELALGTALLEVGGREAQAAVIAKEIARELAWTGRGAENAAMAVDVRLAAALARLREHLDHAQRCDVATAAELVVFELRAALDSIGELIDPVHDEELLDHVFGRFCIGK
jgi:tRNA modification GTPase